LLEEEKLVLNNVIRFSTFPFIREKIYLYVYSVISSAAMRLAKPFLIVIFVFSPVLITFSLIFAIFQTTPLSYIPASSDEIDYWHETQTFVDYGFSGGQYAYHELPAPLEFTGFGVHGPAFPVLYGIFGKIFGWEYYTGVLINLLLVTLALVIFVFLGNLDRKQLLSGIILIGTYWPLLLYLPTNMAESLNHAIAIVISVLFFLQLRNKENNNKVTLAIFIILVVSMMIRVTWSLLFFPLFLFMIDNDKDYKLLGAIILSVAGILLGFIYTRNFYAPFPMVFRSMLDGQRSLPELFLAAKIQVFRNFQNLFFEADTPFFIQAFRYQILGISVYLIYKLIRYFTKGESIKGLIRSELSFHFLNIVVPFIGVVTLFEVVDTRDYRNLAVSLLLSALVLLLFSRYKYILPFILVNGVLIVSFIPGYTQQRSSNFIYDKEIIETFSNRISPHVSFDETKSNRWCNTLGFIKHRKVPFIAVDSGIGHSSVDDVSEDTKSKYLLLPDEYVNANLSKIEALGLVELEKTNLGVLYLNPNSDCE
jgi:hypothetical protein